MTVQPLPAPSKKLPLPYRLAFLGLFALAVVVVTVAFNRLLDPLLIWVVLLTLLLAVILVLSRAMTGHWLGILIDGRNKYSLSRFQMLVWTIIVLSSFVAAVLANVQLQLVIYVSGAVNPAKVLVEPVGTIVGDVLVEAGVLYRDENDILVAVPDVDLSQVDISQTLHDGQQIYVPRMGEILPVSTLVENQDKATSEATTPLSVVIPSEVWLLLGISTTSLVASPLIRSQKSDKILKNDIPAQAGFSDLFKVEEGDNSNALDLAKVQMFFFTLIIIGTYCIAVASMFIKTQNAITSLPPLDAGVVAMLGVSHAGYLTNKAVPHNQGEKTDDATSGVNPPPPPDDTGAAG